MSTESSALDASHSRVRRRPRPTVAAAWVLAGLSLLLLAPAAPAVWSTIHHWRASTGSQGESGDVTVAACHRRELWLTWSCTGTFHVGDPYDGDRPESDVTIANGPPRYAAGDVVGVDLIRGRAVAYYWDDTYSAEVLAAAAGAVLIVAFGVLGIAGARRRRMAALAATASLVGVLTTVPLLLNEIGVAHTPARVGYTDAPATPQHSTSPGPGKAARSGG